MMITTHRIFERICAEESTSLIKLNELLSDISKKNNIEQSYILRLLKRNLDYISIPARSFNSELSPFENIVLYMTAKLGFSKTEVARIVKRDQTTVWITLNNAIKKISMERYNRLLDCIEKDDILLPISIFTNRILSALESICCYIKEKYGLSHHHIAVLLGKDDRTIWTVLNRAKTKISKYTEG